MSKIGRIVRFLLIQRKLLNKKKQGNKQEVVKQQNDTLRDIAEMDKISAALPQVRGLGELADNELEKLSIKQWKHMKI